MSKRIQITLSADDWANILWWCNTHYDRSPEDPDEIKDYNQTEKSIDRLYKKVYKVERK